MKSIKSIFFLFFSLLLPAHSFANSAEIVNTPYADQQKIVFDFYFDEPQKINSALYWLKALVDPLIAEPYNLSPDDIEIKVVIHGTEVVSLAKHNYAMYKNAVERASPSVCGQPAPRGRRLLWPSRSQNPNHLRGRALHPV